MKKENILSFLSLIGMPLVLMALGLVLILSPDSASALIAQVLGWILCIIGGCIGFSAISGSDVGRVFKILGAAICLGAGIYLLTHPLILASFFGRVIGIILAAQGISDIITAAKSSKSGLRFAPSLLMSAITTLIGAGLILVPLNASRFLMIICGIALLLVGISELVDRLRIKKKITKGDPNIIDAEQ